MSDPATARAAHTASVTAAMETPVRVLHADPDLGQGLDDAQFEEAGRALVAPAMSLTKGRWNPRHAVPAGGQLGVLVTHGILCRELVIGDGVRAELVGPGDLLRPWDDGANANVLVSHDIFWHVLEKAGLAVLDQRFVTAAARWPALTSALVARAIARSNALALAATIPCMIGLDTRLLMLFWHMADRWGRVRRDGVVIPVRITHELIARLIGARRPSVSTSLKQLSRDGLITRLHGGGWLLRGSPPPRAGVDRHSGCGSVAPGRSGHTLRESA